MVSHGTFQILGYGYALFGSTIYSIWVIYLALIVGKLRLANHLKVLAWEKINLCFSSTADEKETDFKKIPNLIIGLVNFPRIAISNLHGLWDILKNDEKMLFSFSKGENQFRKITHRNPFKIEENSVVALSYVSSYNGNWFRRFESLPLRNNGSTATGLWYLVQCLVFGEFNSFFLNYFRYHLFFPLGNNRSSCGHSARKGNQTKSPS